MAKGNYGFDSPALGRENWGSKLGVILAVAGSAVGLGNFLRFPGLAAIYGGGIFMIPYFISLLLLAFPIGWMEWTLGRYGGAYGHNSAPGIFSVIWRNRVSKYFGVLALIIPVGIYMYYVYIEAWCLAYAWDYAVGTFSEYGKDVGKYQAHFGDFVGVANNGFNWNEAFKFLVIVFVINFALIYRGLTRGIETFCKFAMPLLLIVAIIILVRVLTFGTPDPSFPERSVNTGLGFMWNPKPDAEGRYLHALLRPELWMAASGQVFFSTSVGFGIVLNYASYLRRGDDVALSSLTAASTNAFCEVCLAGLITVPVAFIFLGPANLSPEVLDSSFALGFQALPAVFARMPAGQFFGALWFLMLFVAAITSSLSMLQPAIAFLEQGLGMSRHVSVTCLGLIAAVGGLLVVYFSKSLLALDTFDFWVGTVCIYTLATIEIILAGWVFGVGRARTEISRGAELRIPRIVWPIVKYVSPLYLLTIFAGFLYFDLKGRIDEIRALPDDARATVLLILTFIIVLFLFFGLLVNLAGKRWNLQNRVAAEGVRSPVEGP